MPENKARIRVLQVSKFYSPWMGGIERVVQDIAEGLKNKVDMEILVCQPKGWGAKEVVNGVPVTRATSLGIYWRIPISFTFPFLLACKSKKVDVIHFHLPFPLAVLSCLLMELRKKKIVVTYHSDIVRQKKLLRFYKPFLHRFLKLVDRIIVTSPNLLESSEHLRPYKDKCVIVPLSINLNKYNRSIEKKTDLRISQTDKVILFVGRLVYYKGVEYLIEAMQDVEAKLLIVGEGYLRNKLEQKARSLKVEQKIMFLGKISDEELKYCYQICDLFVLPSVEPSEAFGIVQMEAMAYGKPVVNTNLPTGVPYVSINGETGITVAPRNSKALADAINRLLNDEELKKKYGTRARKRVEENFTIERMNKRILEIYEKPPGVRS